jgi:hypothetical protein
MPVIPTIWVTKNQKIAVQDGRSIKWDPISKVINAKSAGGLAQVVVHLSSKHKALSSTLSTIKKTKTITTNIYHFSLMNQIYSKINYFYIFISLFSEESGLIYNISHIKFSLWITCAPYHLANSKCSEDPNHRSNPNLEMVCAQFQLLK